MRMKLNALALALIVAAVCSMGAVPLLADEEPAMSLPAQANPEVREPSLADLERGIFEPTAGKATGAEREPRLFWGLCGSTCDWCLTNEDCPLFHGIAQQCLDYCY